MRVFTLLSIVLLSGLTVAAPYDTERGVNRLNILLGRVSQYLNLKKSYTNFMSKAVSPVHDGRPIPDKLCQIPDKS